MSINKAMRGQIRFDLTERNTIFLPFINLDGLSLSEKLYKAVESARKRLEAKPA
jgi:hypothetical protein